VNDRARYGVAGPWASQLRGFALDGAALQPRAAKKRWHSPWPRRSQRLPRFLLCLFCPFRSNRCRARRRAGRESHCPEAFSYSSGRSNCA